MPSAWPCANGTSGYHEAHGLHNSFFRPPVNEAASRFPMPPRRETAEGRPRRIGVELELGGIEIDTLSALVAEELGGEVRRETRYEHEVAGDPCGPWKIELDFEYLKKKGREDEQTPEEDRDLLDEAAEGVLRLGASQIVPLEVVSPPLTMDRLPQVNALVARLRDAGALGTAAGLAYAFGLQLNPELPDLEARTITAYLQAFLCLYDWLAKRSSVDPTRKLTRFAAPFPASYVRRVVDPGYEPGLETLMDDYLADNATRNRPLDLLPLFLHLDKERLRRVVEDPRVKPRPALHYRLPNCEIDRPGWGVHEAWAGWLQVEYLVSDPARLASLRRRYADYLDSAIKPLRDDWAEEVRPWLVTTGDH